MPNILLNDLNRTKIADEKATTITITNVTSIITTGTEAHVSVTVSDDTTTLFTNTGEISTTTGLTQNSTTEVIQDTTTLSTNPEDISTTTYRTQWFTTEVNQDTTSFFNSEEISTTPYPTQWFTTDVPNPQECYEHFDGSDYDGTVSSTIGGHTCEVWTFTEYYDVGDHNYCRNPDGDSGVWCFTTSPGVQWDYCDIGDPSGICI
ncbi:uncharacterized protein LOC144342143 [Saccoglossus kowalevskii]